MKYSDTVLAARYKLNLLTPENVVEFADQKLSDGFYSDHYLNIIDEDFKFADVLFPIFKLALIELKVIIPNSEEATLILVEYHIMEILRGKVDPYSQFDILVHELNFEVYQTGIGVDDIYIAFVDEIFINGNPPVFDYEMMNFNITEQCKNWAKVNGKEY